jgi:hypothetical protein
LERLDVQFVRIADYVIKEEKSEESDSESIDSASVKSDKEEIEETRMDCTLDRNICILDCCFFERRM